MTYDKASVLHYLEEMHGNTQPLEESRNETTESEPFGSQAMEVVLPVVKTVDESLMVIIIDGKAVVNSVSKIEQKKTCQDFADSFLEIICDMAASYDEVRLAFDRYIKTSLKDQMRVKRTKGKSTYYHVKDNTFIQNFP